jgi:hypothetical protein
MTPVISDTDLINIKEVERSVGLKKSSIYERISNNEFRSRRNSEAEPPAGYAVRSKSGKTVSLNQTQLVNIIRIPLHHFPTPFHIQGMVINPELFLST